MISFIIPIYNAEKYLKQCLNSVMKQTFSDIEIICVNDGSTDKSGNICEEYAKTDKRIKVIHQNNKGVSEARNAALNIAKGEYIAFVDSDDYISPEYAEIMLSEIKKENADMVICRFFNCKKNDNGEYIAKECVTKAEKYIMKGEEILPRRFESHKVYYVIPCNKLIKKEIFKELRFPSGRICEDAWLSLELYKKCRKIVCIDDPLYYYRNRFNSNSNNGSVEWTNAQLEWLEHELDYFYHSEQKSDIIYPAKQYISLIYKNHRRKDFVNQSNMKFYWKIAVKELLKSKNVSLKEKVKYIFFSLHV